MDSLSLYKKDISIKRTLLPCTNGFHFIEIPLRLLKRHVGWGGGEGGLCVKTRDERTHFLNVPKRILMGGYILLYTFYRFYVFLCCGIRKLVMHCVLIIDVNPHNSFSHLTYCNFSCFIKLKNPMTPPFSFASLLYSFSNAWSIGTALHFL